MDTLIVIGASSIFLGLALGTWLLIASRTPHRAAIRKHLRSGVREEGRRPPRSAGRLSASAERFTPARLTANLERRLALAGRPAAWPLRRLIVAKILAALGAALTATLLVNASPGPRTTVLALFVVVVAYFVPDLLIYSKGNERQVQIGQELPDTLDQMTIAVEAGLGFDSAMARTGQNGKGPLAAELVRTLQDMQLGMSRREAYLALSHRTSAPDLRRFVNAILQADKYGISITAVLRTQASEMRIRRRQRAEEKAMQIPVKVLFPLMVCIMPVLFIALLGPAAINVVTTLSG